jgi:hypothetical protein
VELQGVAFSDSLLQIPAMNAAKRVLLRPYCVQLGAVVWQNWVQKSECTHFLPSLQKQGPVAVQRVVAVD